MSQPISGLYNMFAKIICKNTEELKSILIDKINTIEGVEKTETNISLEKIISNPDNLLK